MASRGLLVGALVAVCGTWYAVNHRAPRNSDGGVDMSQWPTFTPASPPLADAVEYTVPCSQQYDPFKASCHPTVCGRRVVDGFVTDEEVAVLRRIAEKGMAGSTTVDDGGPCIFDVTTGYRLDAGGLHNVFRRDEQAVLYTDAEIELYADVFDRIRDAVAASFDAPELGFTAPTFITRIVAKNGWTPSGIHDEYWHPHVDKNNTEHYDYSGLVYLSTYGQDFTGGLFKFFDGDTHTHTVQPRAGRFSYFTAGMENLHRVEPVVSGQRMVMSFWFTCDLARKIDLRDTLRRTQAAVRQRVAASSSSVDDDSAGRS